MNTTTKLAAFGLALVAIVGTGAGIGATVGPDATRATAEAPAPIGQGVVATEDGYRLVPLATDLDPDGGDFRFVIETQSGEPAVAYASGSRMTSSAHLASGKIRCRKSA